MLRRRIWPTDRRSVPLLESHWRNGTEKKGIAIEKADENRRKRRRIEKRNKGEEDRQLDGLQSIWSRCLRNDLWMILLRNLDRRFCAVDG